MGSKATKEVQRGRRNLGGVCGSIVTLGKQMKDSVEKLASVMEKFVQEKRVGDEMERKLNLFRYLQKDCPRIW